MDPIALKRLQTQVELPEVIETTAWGAACLAGLQSGVFNGLSDISDRWLAHTRYKPVMKAGESASLYEGWQDCVSMLLK